MLAGVAWRAADRAGIAALEGQTDEAIRGYLNAWRRHRELGLEFFLARSILDASMLLGPDVPEVSAAGPEARAIFERLRARPYLEMLERVLPSEDDGTSASVSASAAAAPALLRHAVVVE